MIGSFHDDRLRSHGAGQPVPAWIAQHQGWVAAWKSCAWPRVTRLSSGTGRSVAVGDGLPDGVAAAGERWPTRHRGHVQHRLDRSITPCCSRSLSTVRCRSGTVAASANPARRKAQVVGTGCVFPDVLHAPNHLRERACHGRSLTQATKIRADSRPCRKVVRQTDMAGCDPTRAPCLQPPCSSQAAAFRGQDQGFWSRLPFEAGFGIQQVGADAFRG